MSSQKPLLVIVPGAFHRPDAFPTFDRLLKEAGFDVLTINLVVCSDDARSLDPELGCRDTSRGIHSKLLPLLDEGREAVMVAHSSGALSAVTAIEGQTVAERAARGLKGGITAYVAIAAVAFKVRGKGIMGDDTQFEPQVYQNVEAGMARLNDKCLPIWYSDIPADEAKAAFDALYRYKTWKSFTGVPDFVEGDVGVPKTYVLCEEDAAIPPASQEVFVVNGGFDEVVRVPSGHQPFLKIPERMVEVLRGVVEKVSSS